MARPPASPSHHRWSGRSTTTWPAHHRPYLRRPRRRKPLQLQERQRTDRPPLPPSRPACRCHPAQPPTLLRHRVTPAGCRAAGRPGRPRPRRPLYHRRHDRSRHNLDRSPTYLLADALTVNDESENASVAPATDWDESPARSTGRSHLQVWLSLPRRPPLAAIAEQGAGRSKLYEVHRAAERSGREGTARC
jgi:hypothetical protein